MPDAKPAHNRAMSNQLLDVRKVQKMSLPSYPDSEVEYYDGLLTGQLSEINKLDDDNEKGIKTLEFLIKAWSFVDAAQKPLPITMENLKKLPLKDFMILMDKINEVMAVEEEKKKKS